MSRLQANSLLLFVAALWGSTFAIQQVAMDHIGPMAFTSVRFLLGAMAILPLVLHESRRRKRRTQHEALPVFGLKMILATVGVGALLFTGTILQQIGIIYTTVTNAGFLTGFYVVLVPIFGYLLFKRKPHWSVWPAGLACLTGTYILSGAYKGIAVSTGDLWVISSTAFWALHVLMVGLIAHRCGAPIRFAMIQFLSCGVIAGVWALISEPTTLAMILDAGWYIVYAGVVSVGMAFTIQVLAQGYTAATDTAIILSMETVFAALVGAAFLGETLDAIGYAGCSLILFAVLSVELLPLIKSRIKAFQT